MDQVQPQSTSTSQYSGTVSLPNDGQILTIDEPSTGSQQPAPTPAPQTAPTTPTPQATPPQGQQGQPQAAPGQPQPSAKAPDLSKGPNGQPTGAPAQQPVPPAVQKAGVFRQVAEALAGGPRYKYNVDEYGNMQKTPIPTSNAHLAMAIALEGLQGALTGLSQKGPEAAARGGAQAMAQGEQQAQARDQKAKQAASEDYSRRAQVAETNMRMYSMARQVGKMNEESTDSYIAQYHDLATKLQTDFPGYVQGPIKYSDFSKYNVTQDNAIPFAKVPRLDSATGKQSTDSRGIPQWDINYLVVDPKLKASGLFDPDTVATLKKMGKLPSNTGDMLVNTPTSLMMALNLKSQAAQYNVAQQTFGHFFDSVDEASQGTTPSNFTPTTAPTLPDNVTALAETASKQYGVPSQYIKGLISQESGGDPNATSPTGVQGLMQLTQDTAKQMGVTDRTNPQQSVNGGTKYFSQLLHQYNDPKLAFAAYYSGPGAIDKSGKIVSTDQHSAEDTQKYVDSVSAKVGLQESKTQAPPIDKNAQAGTVQGQNNPATRKTLDQWSQQYSTTPSDVSKFNQVLSQTEDNYGQAMAHLMSSGQGAAAANISAFLGGPDAIALHDRARAEQIQQHTLDAQAAKTEKLAADKAALDTAAQTKKQAVLNTLETAQIPANALKDDPKNVIQNLQGQGVTLPPEAIRDAMAIAKYEAPINIASNKLWFKDASLNQQDLLDVVRQFNPTYDVGNYAPLHTALNSNSPESKTISAAAGIANHLHQLEQAAHEIATQGKGAGQYPALNALKNYYNYQSGQADYATLQALTNAVNGEIPKVLSGGFAPDKAQVDAVMKNMTADNSEQQIDKLADMYTGVMHGKIAPLDEMYNQKSGNADKHLDMIPHSLNALFQKHGYETPWAGRNAQLSQQTAQTVPAGAFAVRDPKGNIAGYRNATGQVTLFNQPQPDQGPAFLRPSTQPTPQEAQ